MTPNEISNLLDYNNKIDRSKFRYTGIGPRIQDSLYTTNNRKQFKIWPRDSLDHNEESNKILYKDLVTLINNERHCQRIKQTLEVVFDSLRKCNINNLFNLYCPLDHGCFARVPFIINCSLEAYTCTKNITSLVHSVITSINSISKRKNFVIKELFGCEKNYNIFKKHVEWLIKGNVRYRRVFVGYFILFEDTIIDISKVKWLSGLCEEAKYRVYIQFIFSLTRFILELLRRYFYVTVGNPFGEKLIYYRYDLWQKMQATTINHLVKRKFLLKVRHDYDTIDNNPISTSRIKFHVKKDDLRLICTDQRRSNRRTPYTVKAIFKYVMSSLQNYEKFSLVNLLSGLKHFRRQNKEIYFVKGDIKDCFPNIKQEKVRSIIKESLRTKYENGIIKIYNCCCLLRERKTYRGLLKNGSLITRYTLEPNKLIESNVYETVGINSCLSMSLEEFDKNYLVPNLTNCFLRESTDSKNVYKLIKGIRQGSTYSSIFCTIYIQSAFNNHLKDFFNCDDCKLYQYVDDILFMSTNLQKSQNFMLQLLKGFKDYDLKMNLSKLQCNFECPNIEDKYCRQDDYFVYHKHKVCIKTLKCKYDYQFNDVEIQDTFRVTPYDGEYCVEKCIERSKISPILLDVELNGMSTVIENIYEAALMLSFRVATIMLVSFKFRNHQKNQDKKFITKNIKLITKRNFLAIKLYTTFKKVLVNDLEHRDIRTIVTQALKTVWTVNKMRHRNIERAHLEKLSRRYFMRSIINNERIDLESIMKHLQKDFNKSPFNDLRLPGNDKILTKFYRPRR